MKEFNFVKEKYYKNGDYLEIKYDGNLTEVSDIPKVKMLIEEFLDKGNSHNDMKRNVIYIRTILDDFIETSLIIKYCNKFGDNYEIIKYENRDLFSYKYQKKFEFEDVELKVNFVFGQLETKFIDTSCNFIKSTNIENTKKLSNYVLDQIVALKNTKEIYLDNETKTIIKTYKLFYLENPDFSRKDINLRIQTMVLILNQFNLFTEYKFSIQDDILESFKLTEIVNKLLPLGEITVIKDPIKFDEETRKIIEIVGETIREKKSEELTLNEALLVISKTIYAEKFDINAETNPEEILKYPNLYLDYNEISDSIKLVNTIQGKIDSIKF